MTPKRAVARSGRETVVEGKTVIEGDLILRGDRTFPGPLEVKGTIIGNAPEKRYNLAANGSISAEGGIYARKILAGGSIGTRGDIIAIESVFASNDVVAEGKIDTPLVIADNVFAREINRDGNAIVGGKLRTVFWSTSLELHEVKVNGLLLRA